MPVFNPPHINGHRMSPAQFDAFCMRVERQRVRELVLLHHRDRRILRECDILFLQSSPKSISRDDVREIKRTMGRDA